MDRVKAAQGEAPQAIVLDTETTGLSQPQVLEYAHIVLKPLKCYTGASILGDELETLEVYMSRFGVTKAIDARAEVIHGISKKDVAGLPLFNWKKLPIPSSVEYMIGHNIAYDYRAMGKIPTLKQICTLKLARQLWKEPSSHGLTSLIGYFFPGEKGRLTKNAHGAMVDAKLCLAIVAKALQDFQFESWEDIYDIGGSNGKKTGK